MKRLCCCLFLCPFACFDPANPMGTEDGDGTTGGSTAGMMTTPGLPSGGPGSTSTPPPGSSGADATSSPPTGSGDPTGNDSGATETTDSPTTSGPGDSSDDDAGEDESSSSGNECVQDCSGIACGVDPLCGYDCPEQCGATAECSDDQTYCGIALGNPDHLGTDEDVVGDVIFGHRVTVPANTTLKALGVIAGAAGPHVQLALYTDSAGPQTRLRQTGEITLANDDNRIEVPDTAIVAGDYWVMLHTEGLTSLGRSLDGDNDHEFAYSFSAYPGDGSDSFPLTLDDDAIVEDYRYNLYIVVEE